VTEIIGEIIVSYETNCTTTLEQQVRTMKKRQQLHERLRKQTLALRNHLTKDEQVQVVNSNPFSVPVPFTALMLEPVDRLVALLSVPQVEAKAVDTN
jgi:hypothetical protein